MTDMLVQQQTPNINIHKTISPQGEHLLPMSHSFDDRILRYKSDSASFLELFQRFASEAKRLKFQSGSNGFLNVPHPFLPLNKPVKKIQEKEINNINCDKIEPVNIEDIKNIQVDNISTTTLATIIDDFDEDILLNATSSLIKNSLLIQPIATDSIEKIDDDNSNQTINIEEEKQASNRLLGRISVSDDPIQFFIPTETPSVIRNSPNVLTGSLKRIGSIGTTKKMVRFADSVGRELAQVQYVRSVPDDDLQKCSYGNDHVDFQLKPWSFDVALPFKLVSNTPKLKRFFCLYRQPSFEHPDIYLHEIWKSQIKLEHADIRLKSSSTGEQCLFGTAWVTNASFWKNVTIKYSFNRWITTYEYEAQHRCHSNDFRNIDQFEFNIDIPHDVDRIDFVLRYYVNGQEYWDNNDGKNYTLETESASIPQTTISLPHDCDFNEMRFY